MIGISNFPSSVSGGRQGGLLGSPNMIIRSSDLSRMLTIDRGKLHYHIKFNEKIITARYSL